MANELKELETFEVSLVPKGANKKKFMVRKSEGGPVMDTKELVEDVLNTDAPDEEAIGLALKAEKVDKATDKQKSVISGAVRLLDSIKSDFPKLGAVIERLAKLGGKETKQEEDEEDKDKKAAKKKEDAPKDEIKKEDLSNLSPEMQATIKAVMKSNEDLLGRVAKTEESNKALVDEIETKKFVAKAEELTHLGIEAEELGPVLKELSEKAPDAFEKLQPILEGANKTIKSSAFREIGSSTMGGGTSYNKIEKMAADLVKGDSKLSQEQAMSKVLKTDEGQELLKQYRDEKGGK